MQRKMITVVFLLYLAFALTGYSSGQTLPIKFDLRDYNGENYVTEVRMQSGGTCWTHGTMASIESNLLMTGAWASARETGEPNIAEYHLDWWNGFNTFNNDDVYPPTGSGLIPHEGGDFLVASAYITRGEGAVRDVDAQSFEVPPFRSDTSWHYYYARDIEWLSIDDSLNGIEVIKQKIMDDGALATAISTFSTTVDYRSYLDPGDNILPDHAVAIVGWDDTLWTPAPLPGAWLCKNSWGDGWAYDGYFWMSFYDKHTGKHPEMGAVSFCNIEPMQYDFVYYHDYHGWRDTLTNVSEAFNAFIAEDDNVARAVNFVTAVHNVTYTVKVYDAFQSGELESQLASKSGTIEFAGYHTVDFDTPVELLAGDDFYVYLSVSDGGQAYDRTSEVPVLLGADYRTMVESSANPGESFLRSGGDWVDLYDYELPEWNSTANFCIKVLADYLPKRLNMSLPDGAPDLIPPGEPTEVNISITDGTENFVTGTGLLHYRYEGDTYHTCPLTETGKGQFIATLPSPLCSATPEFYISAEGSMGSTINCPPAAPLYVYSTDVGVFDTLFFDDFETDQGWMVQNYGATAGGWERGIPVNDPSYDYDPDSDADGSGHCYLTMNEYGESDVDSGQVVLISPIFDFTEGGTISYDYYHNLSPSSGDYDMFLVELIDDGGVGEWVEMACHTTNGGTRWWHEVFTDAQLTSHGLDLTSNMRMRITVNDSGFQSIVEAGLDHVVIGKLKCEYVNFCGDCDGSESVDIDDAVYLINYIFSGGPPPDPYENGDVDCSGSVDIDDVVYVIGYIFSGGYMPCDPNGDGAPDC